MDFVDSDFLNIVWDVEQYYFLKNNEERNASHQSGVRQLPALCLLLFKCLVSFGSPHASSRQHEADIYAGWQLLWLSLFFECCLASNYASVQQPLLWIIIVKSGVKNHRAQKYVIRVRAHLHCDIWRTQRQGKANAEFC